MRKTIIAAGMLLVACAVVSSAQTPAPPKPPGPPPKLVFEREVYEYPVSGRRDPFRPLTSNETQGPQFAELVVTGIFYDENPARSLATIRDLAKKEYRVHRGDVIGNATVQMIDVRRVVFSIEEFGMKRQEVLEIKSNSSGSLDR